MRGEVAWEIAKKIVQLMCERTRSIYDEYEMLRRPLEKLGVKVYYVGEIIMCRKLAETKSSRRESFVDPKLPRLFLGVIAETGLVEMLNMRKGRLRLLDLGDGKYLAGKADAMVNIDGQIVPVEIKFSVSKTIPMPQHFMQACMYAHLYNSEFTLLMFLGKMVRIYEVPRDAMTIDDIKTLIGLWETFTPLFLEECSTCPLKKRGECMIYDRNVKKRMWLYAKAREIEERSRRVVLDDEAVIKAMRELGLLPKPPDNSRNKCCKSNARSNANTNANA